MKYAIVCGSHRKDSNSAKVASYLKKAIESKASSHNVYTLDLGRADLPLWDESIDKGDPDWKKILDPISAEVSASEAIIVISPEYGGMASPAIKNFFILFRKWELAHKPGLLVGVSASRGGSYPIAELRMSSYKNTRICYIPEHIIVQNAGDLLNENISSEHSVQDTYLRKRIGYAIDVLSKYAEALHIVRESSVIDRKSYPNGM